jgi:2-dehydro-3-deoxyphosphogluconate aldolase/(4S)-4-hydroxy-2-oxoglutarate aldolase
MPDHTKAQILEQINQTPFFVFFNHGDLDICQKVVRACYEGGIRIFEFTNRRKNAAAVFSELHPWVRNKFPDLVFGAGTIYDAATAERYINIGAEFIVSPAVDDEVGGICQQHEILWIPGCLSPTEIYHAEKMGAAIIKIFPIVASGGPDFIRAMHGPSPHTRFMPTGQLKPKEDSLQPWLEAGAYCVGLGSGLVSRDIIQSGDFGKLTNLCANTLKIIYKHRKTFTHDS